MTDTTMNNPVRASAPRRGRPLAEYGMVLVLLSLCGFFSVVTLDEQRPEGGEAARQLVTAISRLPNKASRVLVVVGAGGEDAACAEAVRAGLTSAGHDVVGVVRGGPREARDALDDLAATGQRVDVIACSRSAATWGVFTGLATRMPEFAATEIIAPPGSRWPTFLNAGNLLNIANQIAVIAIVAIGMTLVILTGGIDLSVGSLIALSSVVGSRIIRDHCGAEAAGMAGMVSASLAAIGVCGGCGLLSGLLVTRFRIPPFIATLGMMLVASGVAYILAEGQSINQVPDAFVQLGRGADVLGLPNAVLLMLTLYATAHVVMTRTTFGRHVYAVGGNAEAARLSGVAVGRVVTLAYVISGLMAGLGGVVMASQLKSGAPTYGQMYELYVIAAVVVGGASLSGGEGRVLGTLIGGFIIAVIQNGMNLTGVESYTQKVVLGLVILAAVLVDRLRAR